jgi:CO dehydrogenase maturation factor
MKIAVSGKGGVGKTLLSAFLSQMFADAGYTVTAIDADPDANLASTIGFPNPENIIPISEMSDLIEERVGVKPGTSGSFFNLSPKVADIPEKYSVKKGNIRLMIMGRIKRGGTGCYCAEGSLVQSLLTHLLLQPNEVVILDMEAGIEHLSRGTARTVDKMIIVVEPGRRSIETARTIFDLAGDLGMQNLAVVGNKIRSDEDRAFIAAALPGVEVLGYLSFSPAVHEADLDNRSLYEASPDTVKEVRAIYDTLVASGTAAS